MNSRVLRLPYLGSRAILCKGGSVAHNMRVHVGLRKDLYIGAQLLLIYSSSAHEHVAYLDWSAVLELGYLVCVQAVNLFTSTDQQCLKGNSEQPKQNV